MSKNGLGRGLDALLVPEEISGVVDGNSAPEGIINIAIDHIIAGKGQPRTEFNDERIAELAISIKEHGVIQPLVVREVAKNKYEVIVGERRLRASKVAGMSVVPCIIKEYDDQVSSVLALIENLQREDLSALEEAVAFQKMMSEYSFTQVQLSNKIGKSRSYIANSLRLLTLSDYIKDFLISGDITAGHGRAILSLSKEDDRNYLAEEIVKQGLSVRQAEDMAKQINNIRNEEPETAITEKSKSKATNKYQKELENRIRDYFGTKIKIRNKGEGGSIEIEYYSEEDLNRILSMIIPEDEI